MLRRQALAWTLVAAASGVAAGQVVKERTEIRQRADGATEVRRISTVIGSPVRLQEGVQYGEIADVVLDENGCLAYAVVRHENRFVMVPWTVARVDYGQRVVMVDATPQILQQVMFTEADWPNVMTPQFTQRLDRAFQGRAIRRGTQVSPDLRPVEPQSTDRPGRTNDRATRRGQLDIRPDDAPDARPADATVRPDQAPEPDAADAPRPDPVPAPEAPSAPTPPQPAAPEPAAPAAPQPAAPTPPQPAEPAAPAAPEPAAPAAPEPAAPAAPEPAAPAAPQPIAPTAPQPPAPPQP